MARIACNTRILGERLTGVQRYTLEILRHLGADADRIGPASACNGMEGHAWEQCVLPWRLRGRLLWSPSNTGPVAVSRQVVTMHDVVPFDLPQTLKPSFVAWYRFLQPRLLRRVAGIIVISDFTRRRLLHHIPGLEDKISVVHNGVDARFHPRADAEIAAMAAKLALPGRRYVLSVGSLEPRKNLARLLRAWERIVPRLPDDVWLVLAGAKGSGRIFGDVETGGLPPRVHLTGHVEDALLPALMSGAMVFCYPSYYEGFGLPPLEAMASGAATITANNSCMPEITGGDALQVDPDSIDAIGDALAALVLDEDLRRDYQRRAIARAGCYDWKTTAEQTRAVLDRFR